MLARRGAHGESRGYASPPLICSLFPAYPRASIAGSRFMLSASLTSCHFPAFDDVVRKRDRKDESRFVDKHSLQIAAARIPGYRPSVRARALDGPGTPSDGCRPGATRSAPTCPDCLQRPRTTDRGGASTAHCLSAAPSCAYSQHSSLQRAFRYLAEAIPHLCEPGRD